MVVSTAKEGEKSAEEAGSALRSQSGRASEHARTAAPFYGGYGTKGNANADCHKNQHPAERTRSVSLSPLSSHGRDKSGAGAKCL